MRALLAQAAILAVVMLGASHALAEPPRVVPGPEASPQPTLLEATIESAFVGKQRVVFVLPPGYAESKELWPAVVAYAGKGESVRGKRA